MTWGKINRLTCLMIIWNTLEGNIALDSIRLWAPFTNPTMTTMITFMMLSLRLAIYSLYRAGASKSLLDDIYFYIFSKVIFIIKFYINMIINFNE